MYHLLGPSAPGGLQQEVARDLAQSATDTLALLDLCRQSDVERFVFASSGGTVYGAASRAPVTEDTMLAPITPYGVSKLVSEHFIRLYERLYGLAGISLRIANPFGPYQLNVHSQGIVAAALERGLQAGQIEIWGDGEIVRDFIYIDDVCSAFINALTYTGSERTFNIGSGIGRSINSVLHDLGRLLPTPGLECVYRPGRQVDAPINVLCNELACVELDWSPSTSWEEGLELTLRWMIEYHEACEIRKS